MITKTFILLGLTAFVVGDGHATSEQKVIVRSKIYGDLKHYGSNKPEHHEEYAWSYPSYEFYYKVQDPHTNDKKGQTETREGDEVKGEYWLYEPDGRKRTVEYSSDKKNGFNAVVKYSDSHKHDQHKEKDHKHDVKVVHEYKKDEEDHKKKEHGDKKDEEDEKDEKEYHFEILKVSHKDDDHKKDDHKDHKDIKHHDDKKKNDKKGHDDDKHKHDDKRGHSSQIMPSLEQYRPFPYRQSRIRYEEPYPEQHFYRRNRKQY